MVTDLPGPPDSNLRAVALLTVYVAYHDARPHPEPGDGPYVAVCNVRPDGSRPEGFPAYDDDGGFPDRNVAYCELSVLRRLETRATTDVVGLCHYRRVLVARAPRAPRGDQPGSYLVSGWDWTQVDAHAAGTVDLLAALGDHHWCTPQAYDVRRAGFGSLAEQFAANHPPALLHVADEAVAACHPELPSFATHLHRTAATPLYNVFLGRREALVRYTAFLWPVLEACAEAWQPPVGDHYQTRWAGFLAERLHGYWLQHVATPQGLSTGTLPLAVLHAVGARPSTAAVPAERLAAPGARVTASLRATAANRLPAALVLAAHRARWRVHPTADPRLRGGAAPLSG